MEGGAAVAQEYLERLSSLIGRMPSGSFEAGSWNVNISSAAPRYTWMEQSVCHGRQQA